MNRALEIPGEAESPSYRFEVELLVNVYVRLNGRSRCLEIFAMLRFGMRNSFLDKSPAYFYIGETSLKARYRRLYQFFAGS